MREMSEVLKELTTLILGLI